jgi:hypothetical protein
MELIHFMNGNYSRDAGLEVSPAVRDWNFVLIFFWGTLVLGDVGAKTTYYFVYLVKSKG